MVLESLLTVAGAVKFVAGLVLAAMLHELTHAAVAVAVGADVRRVDLVGLSVTYALPAEHSRVRDRMVNLAPFAVGTTVAIVAAVTGHVPNPLTGPGLTVIMGWIIYTLLGGLEDYDLGAATDGETSWWRDRTRWWQIAPFDEVQPATQVATLLATLSAVTIALLTLPNSVLPWALRLLAAQVTGGTVLGAICYGAIVGGVPLDAWNQRVIQD